MIRVTVNNRGVQAIPLSPVTVGAEGIVAAFLFSDDWAGLAKTAIFKGSDQEIEKIILNNECTVPPEVLTEAGEMLMVGVYGNDGHGTLIRPTVWGVVGRVEDSAISEDAGQTGTTPSWAAQLQNAVQEAITTANNAVIAAEENADDSEAWAVGTRDGEAIPETDPAYQNYAKYWAERAAASATEGAESAATASGKANEAAASAGTASNKAGEAATSAGNAAASAEAANTAKTAAQNAQTAAEQAKAGAETARDASSSSASQAAESATQAAGSASDAAQSATAAQGSESAAATSAQNAAASEAATATSARNAGNSATAAATSETNAANSATAAAGSAGNAATSEQNASASATAAANSVTAAQTAQSAAEDAQDAAETAAASVSSSAAQIAQNTSDISELSRQLSDLNENVDPAFFVKQLEPGSVNTDGSDNDGPKEIRRRTPKAHALKGSVLCVPDQFGEFYFEIVAIDGSGGSGGWVREWYFEDDEDFRLICRKTDNTAWNTSDEEEFIKTVRFASAPLNYYKYRVGETIRSICHAGADGAPENTIPAFIEGYNAGFEIMECDSRITKDGVFVLLHDATINRTGRNADGSVIAQTLNVSDLTYEQLLEYDFGIWKGAKYAGTKIPKTEEALKLFRDLGVGVYVDLGSYPYFSKEQLWELMEIVNSCGMHDRATYVVQSGYASYILEQDKTANLAALGSNASSWILAATCLTGENAVSLDAQIDTITQDKINNALQHGIPMEAWTVTDNESQAAVDNFSYLTGITGTINPAQLYYRNQTEYDKESIPEVWYGRVTITSGGYMQQRGTVHVNCIIKSNYTATNSPNILHGFPQPKDNIAAVSIIEFTDDLSTISSFGGAITNATGTLIMPHITSEKNYLISGEYQIT